MSKWWALVDLDDNLLVEPYRGEQDDGRIAISQKSSLVKRVLTVFEAQSKGQARRIATQKLTE